MLIVVGLGNPGPKYELTRHNVGHMVIDELARRSGGTLKSHKSRCHILEGRVSPGLQTADDGRYVLATCDSYMNVSGGPVSSLVNYVKAGPDQLLVIHDELDLDPGAVRLKRGGGEGGHNGLKSISQSLGSKDYARLRIGIGRPPGRQDPADYVLRPFARAEDATVSAQIQLAADTVEDILISGFDPAQQRLHTR